MVAVYFKKDLTYRLIWLKILTNPKRDANESFHTNNKGVSFQNACIPCTTHGDIFHYFNPDI